MCIQWVKMKFLYSTYGLFETVHVFAMTSMGFERDVLIWSDLNKSFDCINQFDSGSICNGLIFSKESEPKNKWRRGATLEGTLIIPWKFTYLLLARKSG